MDLSRLQENGMYAILTILWCVHDSNLDSALQLPFILHVIMSQNLPEMCFLFPWSNLAAFSEMQS